MHGENIHFSYKPRCDVTKLSKPYLDHLLRKKDRFNSNHLEFCFKQTKQMPSLVSVNIDHEYFLNKLYACMSHFCFG